MDFKRVFGVPVLTLLLGAYSLVANALQTIPRPGGQEIIKTPGTFNSPNGKCEVTLKTSERGGFLILTMDKNDPSSVNDVTGMIWASDKTLVYTTSPIYGKPGIYVFDCDSNHVKRIVSPGTITKAYPDGADYFELQDISREYPLIVYFYYAPDVDKVDFNKFRTPAYFFQVRLNGTDRKKGEWPR
jgi:hypothetical protein